MESTVFLEISDFLGYCDMNGEEALDSSQVEKLENYIYSCNREYGNGTPLVVDAIYDRLCEILKKVNPKSKFLKEVWSEDAVSAEDLEKDVYKFLRSDPMKSICTCKSFTCQEIKDFVSRLPEDAQFDAHISCKENGHGVRAVYCYGMLEDATSRGRSSAGRNLTKQMEIIFRKDNIVNIEAIADEEVLEIRGEVVLPLSSMKRAREFNKDIVSPFSAVASMLRDSASEEEGSLLDFIAYKVVSDNYTFDTKQEEYEFLESLGFNTPLYWIVPDMTKDTFLEQIEEVVENCENEVKGVTATAYDYYTDGLVLEINDRDLFHKMGEDGGKYNYGNIALKVGYWKQDMFFGYVQTILWTDGKVKYSPVAIIAEYPDMATFDTDDAKPYIKSAKEITNIKDLGVVTAGGNEVRRLPLYEHNNLSRLDAYVGKVLYFRYGGEAGVVPCTEDGTPLSDCKIKQILTSDEDDSDDMCCDDIW